MDILVGNGNLSNSVPGIASGLLTGLIDTDAPLDGAKCRLFKNDFFPGPDSVIGDFTEADYTGYAAGGIAITWHDVTNDDTGTPETIGSNCVFAATGSTTGNTVYGYYVVSDAPALIWGVRFAEPEIFAGAGDSLTIVPRYQCTTP